jgi:dihydroxyacetone kinase
VPARHARKGRNKRDTKRKGKVSDSEIGGDNHRVLAMNGKSLLQEKS